MNLCWLRNQLNVKASLNISFATIHNLYYKCKCSFRSRFHRYSICNIAGISIILQVYIGIDASAAPKIILALVRRIKKNYVGQKKTGVFFFNVVGNKIQWNGMHHLSTYKFHNNNQVKSVWKKIAMLFFYHQFSLFCSHKTFISDPIIDGFISDVIHNWLNIFSKTT